MKTFAFTLGALATLVAAQDVDIPSLPECGQFCANDMLNGQAPGLGCTANDISCVCQNRNFIYGLRDCSAATCGSEDARRIVEFGISICRDAGVEITTGAGGDIEPTATGTDGGDDSTGGASGSFSTIFSTISSDESVITTPVATTTFSDDDGEDTTGTEGTATTPGPSSVTSSEELVSTITTDGSTLVTTFTTATSGGTETETETETSTETSTDGGDGSSTTTSDEDGAAMPQRTMAPAGVLAAGLAVLLL